MWEQSDLFNHFKVMAHITSIFKKSLTLKTPFQNNNVKHKIIFNYMKFKKMNILANLS